MHILYRLLTLAILLWTTPSWSAGSIAPGGGSGTVLVDLVTLLACEDQSNGVCRVEQQFAHSAVMTTDAQVKSTAGFLHCIIISQNDAAPTAGTIIVYDSTAESGTQVFNWTLTTAVFVPLQICPDVAMNTGIYVGFTTTADVNVMVSYR